MVATALGLFDHVTMGDPSVEIRLAWHKDVAETLVESDGVSLGRQSEGELAPLEARIVFPAFDKLTPHPSASPLSGDGKTPQMDVSVLGRECAPGGDWFSGTGVPNVGERRIVEIGLIEFEGDVDRLFVDEHLSAETKMCTKVGGGLTGAPRNSVTHADTLFATSGPRLSLEAWDRGGNVWV